MGWFQDNIWNNIFNYAYPISFIGTFFYLVLSILQLKINDVITNIYILILFDIFIGLCSIISLMAWINIDLSYSNNITSSLDLDLNKVKNKVIDKNI